GNIVQENGTITNESFRDYILLGLIVNVDGVITEVNNAPSIIKQTGTDLYDLMYRSLGVSGSQILPVNNPSALSVWTSSGSVFFPGINWYDNNKNPNNVLLSEQGADNTPVSIRMLYQDGTLDGAVTVIPKSYNPTGQTTVALAGNNATIHYLYSIGIGDSTREFIMLYGQTEYGSAKVAKDNLDVNDSITVFPEVVNSMQLLGHVCCSGVATDFDDINEAWIVNESSSESGSSTFSDPDSVKWKGAQIVGDTYAKNNWITNDGWGGVVTADLTTETLVPQPFGDGRWVIPNNPTWNTPSETDLISTGIRINNITGLRTIGSLRVYIPSVGPEDYYRVIKKDNNTGVLSIGSVFNGDTISTPGWVTAVISPLLLVEGDDITISLLSESYSSTSNFNIAYIYNHEVNNGYTPAEGDIGQRGDSTLKISATSNGGSTGDSYAQLATLTLGSTVYIEQTSDSTKNVKYEILTITDNTTWFEFEVIKTEEGSAGYPDTLAAATVTFSIPIPITTDYVSITDYFLSDNSLSGVLKIGDATESTTQDAYGIDIFLREYTASQDFDIVSYMGSLSDTSSNSVSSINKYEETQTREDFLNSPNYLFDTNSNIQQVFVNGLLLTEGALKDYTVTDNGITTEVSFIVTIDPADEVSIFYFKVI
ncbi:MAG: hypothetical protein DRP42_06405, partial [Tenericutes bacterium]